MRKIINGLLVTLISVGGFMATGCEDAVEIATPNVASPVLVLLEGNSFPSTSNVEVNGTFLELDKTGIMDHTVGIDSIPLIDMEIMVLVDHVEELGALVTDTQGQIQLSLTWADIGISDLSSGNQVRLEFAGVHKGIAFRKYHTVTVQ